MNQDIKRSADQLDQAQIGTSNLSELLKMEIDAHTNLSQLHPATLALAKAIKYLQGPAVITIISSGAYPSEALSMEIEALKERGYSAITITDSKR